MTDEFKSKMSKAMEGAVLVAQKQDIEYLRKVALNKKYADLYLELVLAFVEKFDFHSECFQDDEVDKDLLKHFGKPRSICAWVVEEDREGTISLNYGDDKNPWIRVGEPKFKDDAEFDLKIVNSILEENGIHIKRDSIDGGGVGTQNDYISFDAGMLIDKRNELLDKFPTLYKQKK